MRARRLLAISATALTAMVVILPVGPATATSESGTVPSELRNFPYCEVIPNTASEGTTTEHVFNTLGFNACPSNKWKTITEQDIIDAYNETYGGNATSATINGRRHWVMDSIKSGGGTTSSTDTLVVNGIKFGLKALLEVPAGSATIGDDAYVANTVQRNTTYIFKAGRKIFELIDPQGNVYVMQSYSTQFCPKQTLKNLPKIGPTLQLPRGWRYRTHTPSQDLNLTASGATQIVNDYCRNTYQINPDA
ncbi:MAG: hypothetical protein ACYC0W_07885 [Candidatus Nanopelagicales bacterium]